MEGELPPGRIGPAVPIVTAAPPTAGGGPRAGGCEGKAARRRAGGSGAGRCPRGGSRRSPPLEHEMEVGVNAFSHRVSLPSQSCGVGCWLPQTEAAGARPGRPLALIWASGACSGKAEIQARIFHASINVCVSSTFFTQRRSKSSCFLFFFPAVLPFLRLGERWEQAVGCCQDKQAQQRSSP